jgi:ParB family transcriptional regulator, chromosome partitioning protein
VIARIKDERQRVELLRQAISKNLSLNEIKVAVKELIPESEQAPEKLLIQRWSKLGQQLRKSEAWNDRRKRDRITKLLDELERLTVDS